MLSPELWVPSHCWSEGNQVHTMAALALSVTILDGLGRRMQDCYLSSIGAVPTRLSKSMLLMSVQKNQSLMPPEEECLRSDIFCEARSS